MHVSLFHFLVFHFPPTGSAQKTEELFWTAAALIGLGLLFIIALVLLAALIKIYLKSGKAGLLESVGLSPWLILLLFVPFGQFVLWGMVSLRLARAFGKTRRFGLGIFFLPYIFLPILAWGQAEYVGIRPSADPS